MRCDKSMRRSKERCLTPQREPWRCDKKCESCHCALFQKDDGTEYHLKVSLAHSAGKGGKYV
jgi:hypothetical protein